MSSSEAFRVTVRMKSGGTLDLGTHETLAEAMAAVDEFKADRDDVKWIQRNAGTAGASKGSYVVALGQDGVTDPSIVVSRVEARTTRDSGSRDWYKENKRGREL